MAIWASESLALVDMMPSSEGMGGRGGVARSGIGGGAGGFIAASSPLRPRADKGGGAAGGVPRPRSGSWKIGKSLTFPVAMSWIGP